MAVTRILHILNTLDIGGAEALVLALARAIDRKHFEVFCCSLGGDGALGPEFRALGVPTFALERSQGLDVRLPPRLAALCARERIDVLHSHNVAPWLYGGLGALLARKPLIHTEHSNLFPHQRALMRAERMLAKVTAAVVADSEKVRHHLVDVERVRARKLITIANGIDVQTFADRRGRADARAELGIPADALVLGSVGRLQPVKDQALLLTAFDHVARERPQLHLLLVGDGPLRESLSAQAAGLATAARIHLAGARRDIPRWLAAMDAFVLSSKSEGLPLTVLEAMASGLPVVSTRVGALPEVVLPETTGLLVDAGDVPALARAIARVADDPEARQGMGERGRMRVRQHFSVDGMTQQYELLYLEATQGRRAVE